MTKKPSSVLLLYNTGSDWSEADIRESLEAVEVMCSALESVDWCVELVEVHSDLVGALSPFSPEQMLVFNWCEELSGQPGSEPQVAALLERLGFKYTGAGPWSLTVAQMKQLTKSVLQAAGVPAPEGQILTAAEADGWTRFPAIVKVADQHCSESLDRQSVVDTPAELRQRADECQEVYGAPPLVEEFVDGREFRVCLVGNESPQVLPLVEMGYEALEDYHDRLCSYDAKYMPSTPHYENIELLCPAEVDPEDQARIESTAIAASQALDCRDYARVDIRLRDGIPYVLDVNPNPDITLETSFYYAAEAAGIEYPELANRILELARRRNV